MAHDKQRHDKSRQDKNRRRPTYSSSSDSGSEANSVKSFPSSVNVIIKCERLSSKDKRERLSINKTVPFYISSSFDSDNSADRHIEKAKPSKKSQARKDDELLKSDKKDKSEKSTIKKSFLADDINSPVAEAESPLLPLTASPKRKEDKPVVSKANIIENGNRTRACFSLR